MKKYILIILLISLYLFADTTAIAHSEILFRDYGKQVIQIRVIEKQSGKKNSIGSGFFISEDGYIASNYHVIQSALEYPDKFNLELVNPDQSTEELQIINFDIINDLSIIKAERNEANYFKFCNEPLEKGQKIYSLGNPRDLGFSIVEGINNGLLDKKRSERIFFSGSINPGMSGGPAINLKGEITGINVASSGEQISYLVPVKYLKKLYEKVHSSAPIDLANYFSIAQDQLYIFQESYMQETLNNEWLLEQFGDAIIVKDPADYFKAWGNTVLDEKSIYNASVNDIQTQDRIYINSDLKLGQIYIKYLWLNTDQISSAHFYNIYQSYSLKILDSTDALEENITEWVTYSDFIKNNGVTWKTKFVVRQYKDFPKLYDVALIASTVDFPKKGLVFKIRMKGISKDNALDFSHKLLEKIEWIN